jgi:hypothetical protein
MVVNEISANKIDLDLKIKIFQICLHGAPNSQFSEPVPNLLLLLYITRFRLSIGFHLFHIEGFNRPFSASL